MAKRIVLELSEARFIVIHLMIAGRFRWDAKPGAKIPGRVGRRRVRLRRRHADPHRGQQEETGVDPPRARRRGRWPSSRAAAIEPLEAGSDRVPRGHHARAAHPQARPHRSAADQRDRQRLQRRDPPPRQALADEAKRSALRRGDASALHEATRAVLTEWVERLRAETGGGFPEKVTAFRKEMAVHGKYKEPCPVCGAQGRAHRLRRERGELLRRLSDGWEAARRSLALAAAQEELAQDARRARGRSLSGAARSPTCRPRCLPLDDRRNAKRESRPKPTLPFARVGTSGGDQTAVLHSSVYSFEFTMSV